MSSPIRAEPENRIQPPRREPLPRGTALHRGAWAAFILMFPVYMYFLIMSMGEDYSAVQMAAVPAAAALILSVAAAISSRRVSRLGPAVLVTLLAVGVGYGMWRDAHPGNGGIPSNEVAVSVTYFAASGAKCSIPSDLTVTAGDHTLYVTASENTTVTVTGPQPDVTVVASFTRQGDSGRIGPIMHLVAGSYLVVCSAPGQSASTILHVGE